MALIGAGFCAFKADQWLSVTAFAQDSEKPEPVKPDPKDAEIAKLKREIAIYQQNYFGCISQQIDAAAKAGK